MSEIKLKPCPFCGGKAIIARYIDAYSLVVCEKCGAESRMVEISEKYCSDEKAAEAWNRRVDNVTEAIREFAEKLKALVNHKNYMLADIHNSKDFGMFTLGFEQAVDEVVKEMEEDGNA